MILLSLALVIATAATLAWGVFASSDPLIWVSLAGQQFPWASGTTAALVGAGVVMLVLAAVVATRGPPCAPKSPRSLRSAGRPRRLAAVG